MAPAHVLRCCQRVVGWIPVLFITLVVCWSYYAYMLELCVFTIQSDTEKVIYLVFFHIFFIMFVWSYWKTIFSFPANPSKEFALSKSDKESYEKEERQEYQQEILKRAAKDLPIYTTTATKAIRYCERCQLIKPDRCHHCSACDLCRSKTEETCPQNELADTRAKFHVLFLFFVSAMFFISILSLFSYHCWLVGKNRSTIEAFRAPSFRTGPEKDGFSLGCGKNFRQVFGDEKKYWLIPTFTSLGDGCSFPTRLVLGDPEHNVSAVHSDASKNAGPSQPFPARPLSESQNRLLGSDSQWVDSGDDHTQRVEKNHVTILVES
ncbi:hypothetical protein GDO78_015120 [Eleutherodactylus coqui]|uniref:Palmitoyltransferase n=1 Tax=Eleutherodactylus coqui TaxID=57060 RepID=A0A8J6EDW0_ELECQ|nr:hypothetical protein GDO78_015120 [Eleutherodactylus coqui]